MPDLTSELLGDLEAPRPLSPALRDRLEATLLRHGPAQLDDPASALIGLDAPRPLPADLRERLATALVTAPVRRLTTRRVLVAAAAAAALAFGLTQLLPGPAPSRQLAGPAPSPTAQPQVTGDTTGTGAGVSAGGGAPAPRQTPPRPGPSRSAPAVASFGAAAPGAAAAPMPADGTFAVSSVSPATGPLRGGTQITLSGRGLSHVVAVEVGGRAATQVHVVSDAAVTAVTPARSAPEAVDVVAVLSSGARFGLSPAFRYLPVPTVTGLSPAAGPMAGGNTVTVQGSGFVTGTSVTFGGTAVDRVVVVSSTVLRVVVPSHLLGSVDVAVTTPGGTSASSGASRYQYTP